MTDQQEIQQIKEKIDIVSLISRYLEVKPAGKNFTARCPFHTEKTPSFTINPDMQRYKCFGCQKSGDIFTFLMEYEHIDFPEAVEKLAKEAGVKLEKQNKPVNKTFAILEMINKMSAEFFTQQLFQPIGKVALDYIHGRDYDDETIKTYQIGYAPGRNSLLSYLSGKASFTNEQLLQSGLFVEKNRQVTDKFNNRLMFSVTNERGKIVAFSGRILPGNDYGPKYLNSPETPIFHKRDILFGLSFAKNEIRAKDMCILCESQTDTIVCHKAGVKNVVASLGTALTEDQLRIISKYTKNITLLFDNDTAGHAAVEKAFHLCTRLNLNTYATNTGKYKDLSDLILAEPEKLQDLIEKKQDAFTYLLSKKIENLDVNEQANYQDYKTTINYVNGLISDVAEPASRNFFLAKATEITKIEAENFTKKEHLEKRDYAYGNQQENYNQNREYETNSKLIRNSPIKKERFTLEEYLLYYIIQFNLYNLAEKINPEILSETSVIEAMKTIQDLKVSKVSNEKIASEMAKIIQEKGSESKQFELLQRILFENPQHENQNIDSEVSAIIARIIEESEKRKLLKLRKELSILENDPNASDSEINAISTQIAKLSIATQKRKG